MMYIVADYHSVNFWAIGKTKERALKNAYKELDELADMNIVSEEEIEAMGSSFMAVPCENKLAEIFNEKGNEETMKNYIWECIMASHGNEEVKRIFKH